jgi:hypothetical protein
MGDVRPFARNKLCGLKTRCLGSKWAMRMGNGRSYVRN